MSQLERLREARKAPKTRGKKSTEGSGRLITFKPTEAQKMELRANFKTLPEVLLGIEELCQRGIRFTIFQPTDKTSYTIIARDGTREWRDAEAVSCWHDDLQRAIRGVHYALTIAYPSWPEEAIATDVQDADW